MKKNEAMAVFESRIRNGQVNMPFVYDKSNVEGKIRSLADNDEGFENTVFELGCSVLAKAYEKKYLSGGM